MKKVIRFFLRDSFGDLFQSYFAYCDISDEHHEGLYGNKFIENAYVFRDKKNFDYVFQRFANGLLNRDKIKSFEVIDI